MLSLLPASEVTTTEDCCQHLIMQADGNIGSGAVQDIATLQQMVHSYVHQNLGSATFSLPFPLLIPDKQHTKPTRF